LIRRRIFVSNAVFITEKNAGNVKAADFTTKDVLMNPIHRWLDSFKSYRNIDLLGTYVMLLLIGFSFGYILGR